MQTDAVRGPAGPDATSGAPAPGDVAPAALRRSPLFADLTEADLAWVAAQCELLELAPGEILFRPGETAVWMYIALEGTLQAQRERLGPGAPAFVFRAGEIAGTIPFSRMTTFAGTGRAVTAARVARFPKARFDALLARVPALAPRFVALLADRVRDATRRDAQFEKLAALGRLSAGLAHELNNPAAAAARGAASALARLERRGAAAAALLEAGVAPAVVRALDLVRASVGRAAADRATDAPEEGGAPAADALARADREEALAGWLASTGVPDPAECASTFAEAELDEEALTRALADVPPAGRGAALVWLEGLVGDQLVFAGVRVAARRVGRLVEAMRTYTHMDRARALAEVDVHAGLESALTLLAGRARGLGVVVVREYAAALPPVPGYPAELNQAWGALLDNAIHAAGTRPGGAGCVRVRTAVEGGCVVVEVRDNGTGVPPELQERIFEPFFTTKEVGDGAGLGLDVARRVVADAHGGQLRVASEPGDTRFTVWLPRTTVGTFGS